ncbi:hypothetical protein GL178_11115 [Vibrio toranzoniae]|uniref:hypothetical protein n=1 Tax=Vibrio toranzoniae TaxID=1194427 RepID=UPI001378ACA8|nr:hypothetical protein [Vibrio toranzoniae]NAZ46791.1 hypothetical protein [Vibrio toranzoniae]
MSKLIFITRATKESGKGHFFRVSRMIDSLSKCCECVLVVDDKAITSSPTLKFHPLNINNPTALIDELKLTSNDLIWFDIPDSQYQMIASFTDFNIPLISTNMFERLEDKKFEHISIYPVFEKYKKKTLENKKIQISGSDFISLPEEFFYKNDEKLPQVIVSMGGTDPMGFTPLVLQSVSNIKYSKYTYKFILPKGTDKEHVVKLYGKYPHMEFYEFGSINFSHVLKISEYAIINGGMTRYECVAAKTFFIALSIHEIQASLSEKVTRYGLGENFGVFNEKKVKQLSMLLSSLPFTPVNIEFIEKKPFLRENGARWIYEQVVRELKNENE